MFVYLLRVLYECIIWSLSGLVHMLSALWAVGQCRRVTEPRLGNCQLTQIHSRLAVEC